jgi:hypothetical protein
MLTRTFCLVALTTVVIESAHVTSVLADMQILESNVPAYLVGSRIPDSNNLGLPAGGRVKVLLFPSKQTKVFEMRGAQPESKDAPLGASRRMIVR